MSLLTSDHPIVTSAVDLLLGSEQGNCTFGIWPDENDKTILIEAVFVLEALAPAHLHADRFLPPTPLRILVNHKKEPLNLDLPNLEKGAPYKLLDNSKIGREIIPAMLEATQAFAEKEALDIIAEASSHDRTGWSKHLAHARAALGSFIANDNHITLVDAPGQNGFHCLFLGIKGPSSAGEA